MARINLRPWREERNAALQKRFVVNLVTAALVAGLTIFGISYYYDVQMQRQQVRNNYLRGQIASLNKRIQEIQELKRQRQRLLERLNAIQELQGNRPIIVRDFDELVRVLPDDLYYTSLVRRGSNIAINGLAKDNNDVSMLMRNLNHSIWFGEPSLSRVVASANQLRAFNLSVPLTKPKAEEAQK